MPKKQNNLTKPTKATKLAVTESSAQEIFVGYEDFLRDLKTRIRSTQSKQQLQSIQK